MKVLHSLLAASAVSLLGIVAANAHHSFAAQFDREQTVEFSGMVTDVEWTNPHARFYVVGTDPAMDDETPVNWNIEMVSANVLMRQGWRHDTLKAGDAVTIKATRARKDPHVVNASEVYRDSGERLFSREPSQINQ